MGSIGRLGVLAVAAAVLTGVVGTGTASAETPGWFTFSAGAGTYTWTTLQGWTKSITGSEATCESSGLGQEESSGSEAEAVGGAVSLSECTAFGFANATVSSSGCVLRFTATTDKNEHAGVHLEGCANGGITTTVNVPFLAKCVVHMKNQTFNGAHYVNTPGDGDIDVQLTADDVHFEVTESTGLCPLDVGTHTGTLEAEWTVKPHDGTLEHSKL